MAALSLLNATLLGLCLIVSAKTGLEAAPGCSDWSALQNTNTGLAQQRNALSKGPFLNRQLKRLVADSRSDEKDAKLAQGKLAVLEKILSLIDLSEKLGKIENGSSKIITAKILLDAVILDSCGYVRETYKLDSLMCLNETSEVKRTLLQMKLFSETIQTYDTVRERAPDYSSTNGNNNTCQKHLARNCYVQTHVRSSTQGQREFIDRVLTVSGPGFELCYQEAGTQ